MQFHVISLTWLRTSQEISLFADKGSWQFKKTASYGRGLRNLMRQIQFQFYLFRKLNDFAPGIVYACDLDTLLLARFWARKNNAILIYDQFDPFSSRLRSKLSRYLLQMCEIRFAKSAIIRICANIHRIPMPQRHSWVQLENVFNFEIPKGIRKFDTYTLLYAGVLHGDRGLIEACQVVSAKSEWNFSICGYGPLSNELETISSNSKNINVRGFTPHEKLMKLAARCHLYLAFYDPHEFQNVHTASNKLFEAASIRIPILTSKGTDLASLVSRYGLGWSIEYGDSEEFMKVLTDLESWTSKQRATFIKGCEEYLKEHDLRNETKKFQMALLNSMEMRKGK
jgi:glycosyltransferase involved in cell wall biosynthesis